MDTQAIRNAATELGLLRYHEKQLEQQADEKHEINKRLQTELHEYHSGQKHERREPVFSDFISDQHLADISVEQNFERDDLKAISGIGPGIEKKLYSIGIYSFRQISELTEDSIQQISTAIKFFPRRIQRDNWIGQATSLYLKKINR